MPVASSFGGMTHIAVVNLNAASAAFRTSAF